MLAACSSLGCKATTATVTVYYGTVVRTTVLVYMRNIRSASDRHLNQVSQEVLYPPSKDRPLLQGKETRVRATGREGIDTHMCTVLLSQRPWSKSMFLLPFSGPFGGASGIQWSAPILFHPWPVPSISHGSSSFVLPPSQLPLRVANPYSLLFVFCPGFEFNSSVFFCPTYHCYPLRPPSHPPTTSPTAGPDSQALSKSERARDNIILLTTTCSRGPRKRNYSS